MITLFDHQKKIIDDDKKITGLWLGTGSGKSIITLSLAEGATLVICPKTVRDDKTWQNNLAIIEKTLDIDVISKEDFRLKKYDTEKQYDTLICDEAHFLCGVLPETRQKNKRIIPKTSKIFRELYSFIRNRNLKRIYLLTATPIRSPMAVWGLALLLGKRMDFYRFRDRFYIRIKKGYREFFIPKKDDKTKEILGEFVRRIGYTGRLEDYFDVPDQVYRTIRVDLTKEQKKRLEEIEIEFPDPLVQITKKHQIENGVLKGTEFSPSEIIPDNKIDVIKDLAMEFPKMVVFAKYTQQVNKIKEALGDYHVVMLTGQTKDREAVLKEAKDSKECIIIIQSQISAGYELPDFPVMVFASLDYSVVNKIQAEGRIQRANNLKKNLYINIVARGEIDPAVEASILNKVDFSEHIYYEKINNRRNL